MSYDDLFHPTEEHRTLRELVASFTTQEVEPQAARHDELGTLNVPLLQQLGELGLLGLTVPAEDGGAGMDSVAAVIVHHELSRSDPGFCLAYLAHALLFVNNFYHCSNADQRARYLDKVISGEWIGGMGMTEPGAGTDVLGMTTTAVRDGDSWVLNGTKTYITNGCEGFCFLVYAKVEGRITAFVVDRDCPGFSSSQHIDKLGMRGSTMSELIFDDCRIPVGNLLGQVGGGLTHMMRNLEIERLGLAAMSVGIADRCVDIMVRHAQERRAFGQPLASFGQIQRYVADGYAMTEAAKCFVYNAAREVSADSRARLNSDAVKLFAAPVGKTVADWAMQVMGGSGYCREYPVERLWRDAKLLEIGGGTLEAHQKNITKDLVKLRTLA
ncbi:MAG: acyl-CoA dehydrogenase family protein [Alphaproteobacteria bacterium]|nr:acyl-CoA dehydrogenase family protein [Alphaproteobacteria bacterium]